MKYSTAIFIIIISILSGMFFELPLWSYIGLTTLLFVLFLIWEFTVLKQHFRGGFQMKSHKKTIGLMKYLGMIPFMTSVLFEDDYRSNMDSFQYGLLFFLITFVSIDIIVYILYKFRKPVTIYIDKDVLVFNNRWPEKRDLKKLNYIGIPSFTGELELGFITKSDVRLPFKEYKPDEFRRFLEILVEKSEHNVYLTEDVEKKFPASLLKLPN